MQPLVKLIDLKQNLGKNKLKLIWCSMPEILLITETCFYWYYTSLWNPVAIILLVVLLSVFFFKNSFLILGVSILFFIVNMLMYLALLSELKDLTEGIDTAQRMLIVGGIMLVTGLIGSASLLIKWGLRQR